MKTYTVKKVNHGYQVIWCWSGDYFKTGFKPFENYVKDGFFRVSNSHIDFIKS